MNNCNGTADPAASVSRRAEKRTAQEIETIRGRQLQSGWPFPNLAAHFREAAAGAEGVSIALTPPAWWKEYAPVLGMIVFLTAVA